MQMRSFNVMTLLTLTQTRCAFVCLPRPLPLTGSADDYLSVCKTKGSVAESNIWH